MSERTDLLGERATIWVSSYEDDGDARGAVLIGSDAELVHIIAIDPYPTAGTERAVYVIEHIAMRMSNRLQKLTLSVSGDTMPRLPLVADVAEGLDNAHITVSRYGLQPG